MDLGPYKLYFSLIYNFNIIRIFIYTLLSFVMYARLFVDEINVLILEAILFESKYSSPSSEIESVYQQLRGY